ncbi:unnamed protein product [Owenia fusiformis]|uniref:Uncharacterized protein n=1 Tax=Owenia fusiformis TaxID=6347 RepID=A0A8J1UFT4_OWEFU|nr:unnamed protein product [Owenia fusiformis]
MIANGKELTCSILKMRVIVLNAKPLIITLFGITFLWLYYQLYISYFTKPVEHTELTIYDAYKDGEHGIGDRVKSKSVHEIYFNELILMEPGTVNLYRLDNDYPNQSEKALDLLIAKPNKMFWRKKLNLTTQILNVKHTKMDDPLLLEMLRLSWIYPPSLLPYNLKQDLDAVYQGDYSKGQSAVVDKILNHKRNGFFVECGGFDGESRSNSLFFEQRRNWRGILIEADPYNFVELVNKNRKAYSSDTCLSILHHPFEIPFKLNRNLGRIMDTEDEYSNEDPDVNIVPIQCFPFYSYLLALKVTHVDYFSLDVEGLELEVLRTIPFHKITIDVISAEFIHGAKDKVVMQNYMEEQGFHVAAEIMRSDNLANDFIFVRNGFKP